ncbi:thioredoxin family protein [Haloarchaeobius sp. TZWWS8]|uniref:thioredoxin family protein n=1 Tax=Haloarchaeobius sp. TZWWS8 TaxID=3446121 RepID=UPI003EBD18EA
MTDSDELEAIREAKKQALLSQASEDAVDAARPGSTPDEPIHVESVEQFEAALDEYEVVLVDFYADWCGPCQALGQYIGEVAAESTAAVLKVDVDVHQGLAGQYGVQGIPNLLVFRDGETVQRLVGLKQKEELLAAIEAA